MHRSNRFIRSIHLIIGTILLALALHTWVVMGLIAPVTVSGSSMAPTLQGRWVTAHCPRCHYPFHVGAEYTTQTNFATCPRCAEPRVPLNALPFQTGDRLWIDRTAFTWRSPQRWEVVVSCCPHDAEQLCVKRIVGLPGEAIRLAQGEVWTSKKILRKNLAEQIVLRQTVHVVNGVRPRWQPQVENAWQWQEGRWQCEASNDNAEHWLRYTHWNKQPVTDDSSYNAGVSRRLNRVHDFMLSATLRMTDTATVALEIHDGQDSYRVTLHPKEQTARFKTKGKTLKSSRLPPTVCKQLQAGEPVEITFSNFDRQLLLAFADNVAFRYPLNGDFLSVGTTQPVAIGVWGGNVSIEGLTLYRDIYYGHPRATNSSTAQILKPDQYLLLGDNAPISIDSRSWGPVPARLFLGKPLGVR